MAPCGNGESFGDPSALKSQVPSSSEAAAAAAATAPAEATAPAAAEATAATAAAQATAATGAAAAAESTGAATTTPSVPRRHVGPVSWSWVPGVCGSCGASASGWSFISGGPPWLPRAPQARLHLRMLWGFYTSSLPSSCVAMRGALGVGALSALRAEATLLSLLSRGLGFSGLSLSARRLAEVCDAYETGGPNPAWGPQQHPLGQAEGPRGPRVGSGEAQPQSRPAGDSNNSCDSTSSSRSSSSSSLSNSAMKLSKAGVLRPQVVPTAGPRRPRGLEKGPPRSGTQAGKRTEAAGTGATTTTSKSAYSGPTCKETCSTLEGPPSLPSRARQQQPQQQTLEQQQQHQKQQEQQHQQQDEEQQQQQQQQQPQQQQQQQQDVWERVAALRREASSSGIRMPGHPVYEALVACLIDLHAAKEQLAVLFQEDSAAVATGDGGETAAAAAAAASKIGTQQIQPAEETAEGQCLLQNDHPEDAGGQDAGAQSVAARTTTAAIAALQRLATSGHAIAAAAAVVRQLKWPSLAAFACLAGAPSLVLRGVSKRAAAAATTTTTAAAAAAAATTTTTTTTTTTAQRCYSRYLLQHVVFLGNRVWNFAAPAATAGQSLCLANFSLIRRPLPLLDLMHAAGEEARKGWETICQLVRQLLLRLAAAEQQLQQLLLQLQAFGMDCLREHFGLGRGDNCSNGSSSSPWATPQGLKAGASSSTCYWSPPEDLAFSSHERQLRPSVSELLLPSRRDDEQQLQHHLQQQHQQQLCEVQEQQLQQQQQLRQQLLQQRQEQRHQQRSVRRSLQFGGLPNVRSAGLAVPPEPTQCRGSPGGAAFETSSFDRHGVSISSPATPTRSWPWGYPYAGGRREETPAGDLLGEGDEFAACGEKTCEEASSRDIPKGLRRNTSFRKLSQAAAATRAAAAGATAAAATASWAAANAAAPSAGARRGHQRHVSFITGSDETPRHTATTRDNWNAYVIAAAARTGMGAPQNTTTRRYNSRVYTLQGDRDSCWAGPPMGPLVVRGSGGPPATTMPPYNSRVCTPRDNSGGCCAGPPKGHRLDGAP